MAQERSEVHCPEGLLSRPTSRRTVLRGLAALMIVGAAAPLGAACAPQPAPSAPAAKDSGAKPAAPQTGSQPAQPSAPQSGGQAAPASGEQPKRGGTLKIALLGEPPSLDIMFTTATITRNIGSQMFETLYANNSKMVPQPHLAEKGEISSDGKTWTFTLRKGVPFHNGQEMTADDVVASLKRWGAIGARGKVIFDRVDSVEAQGKYTVVMKFKQPTGATLLSFLAEGSSFIMPKDLAEKYPKDQLKEYIGTGPYQFVEHVPDRHVRLKRFEGYVPLETPPDFMSGKRVAYIDELLMIPVPETSVRVDGVGTGEYHFADSLNPDQYETVKAQPGVTPIIVKPYYWLVFHFNKKEGLFTNKKLRQAVLAALSMEPIAKSAVGPPEFYRLGPNIAAEETSWYNDAGKEVYNKPDPEKAKALMKEAGYDGTPIRWMSTKEYFYNYNGSLPAKQQLEAVGFKVDLQVMDWATLVKRRSDPKEYDVFVTGHEAFSHPVLQPYLASNWPGFWENAQRDQLVSQIFAEPDPQKVNELVGQLQALQWEEVPCIKVCEYFLLQSRRNELKGYGAPTDWYFWNAWLG